MNSPPLSQQGFASLNTPTGHLPTSRTCGGNRQGLEQNPEDARGEKGEAKRTGIVLTTVPANGTKVVDNGGIGRQKP
jgi:hypothetical protein